MHRKDYPRRQFHPLNLGHHWVKQVSHMLSGQSMMGMSHKGLQRCAASAARRILPTRKDGAQRCCNL
jgi:hypothetical protein